jgi:ATP-binding cassette subfamily B protein
MTLSPEARLVVAAAAERLGGNPAPAYDAYRSTAASYEGARVAEIAALAAGCGLVARLAAPDELVAPGEAALLIGTDGDGALLGSPGPHGRLDAFAATPEGEVLRLVPAQPDAWPVLLFRAAPGAPPPGAEPFGLGWFFRRIAGLPAGWGGLGALRRSAHGRELLLIALAAVAIHVIAIGVPLVFGTLVDRVLPREERQTLLALVVLLLALLVAGHALQIARDRKIAWIAARVDSLTSSATFGHLLSLPLSYFGATRAGVVSRNLALTEPVREFLLGPVFETALRAIGAVLALTALFVIAWPLAVGVLLASLLLALVVRLAWTPFKVELEELQTLEGARAGLAVETIRAAPSVKAMAMEWNLAGIWDPLSAEIAMRNRNIADIRAVCSARLGLIEKMTDVFVIGFGVWLVLDGHLSIGAVVAAAMIAGQVTEPALQAATLVPQWQQARKEVGLLGTIMEAEPEPEPVARGASLSPPAFNGGFILEDIALTYPNADRPAVEALDIAAEPPGPDGVMIALVGESGSGKSSIVKLLLGLHQPSAGRVLLGVDGVDGPGWTDLRDCDPRVLRQRFAVVSQTPDFFSGILRDNLALAVSGAAPDDGRMWQALDDACAAAFVEAHPDGLDMRVEEAAGNLSGGQRQRLAIAQALLRDPPILILDEATSALDPTTEALIRNNIRSFARGRTLLVVAHRLHTIRDADLIVVMQNGFCVESGTHDELAAIPDGYYAAMLQAQNPDRPTKEGTP